MTNGEPPEVLQRVADAQKKLAALGIAPEHIQQVQALIGQLTAAQESLVCYRHQQFMEDARALFLRRAAHGEGHSSPTTALFMHDARFLREFAEHVAGAILGDNTAVESLVDTIVAMSKDGHDA